ncbi:MAG: lysophospholipid acyltransferase family protein [Odoribacteraceae bacterium]|jgi:KDO2-lipid IV(A) lauroyltransferase|nr:lysophospholipid acyltransferase family protein [Odoribacteraceae bacterium]
MFSYLLYAFLWAFSFLPFWLLYLCSDIGYFFAYHLFRYRRGEVRANLRHAFPEKGEREIRRVERKFYHHLLDVSVEFYKLWHAPTRVLRARCVFTNPEVATRYLAAGRSVIAVMGHYANWEWLSLYGLHVDFPFVALYKPLHDRVMDRLSRRLRSRPGTVLVPKNDVARAVLRYRGEGRAFLLALVADQAPKESSLNFWTTFLNQETSVFKGTERIAVKYDMPVLFLEMRKTRRGHYEAEFHLVSDRPGSLPPGELTRAHTRVLEAAIRERPEYWLWSHRRWKYKRPPGAPLH